MAILSVGTTTAPDNSAFWLASGATLYQVVRDGLAVILIIQLLSTPPRQVWFRILTGAISIGTFIWVIYESYMFRMFALDGLAFMTAAISIAITSLERPAPLGVIRSHINNRRSRLQLYSSH